MKILYLYAELMPYQIIVFRELIKTYNVDIYVVYWDKNKLTPYQFPEINNVKYIPRSKFKNKEELYEFANLLSPELIYASGWMDPMYIHVAKKMKKANIPVVAGSDTQWRGGRQWINVILSVLRHKRWFSHIWVSGPYQYEYARKLGFDKKRIIFNSLTADVSLHKESAEYNVKSSFPKSFVFIGRFNEVKGISILLEAYRKFKKTTQCNWKLICIGNGDLKSIIEKEPEVTVFDFMTQVDFAKMSDQFGFLILPSIFEPWGVILHEATCLGLPIVCSDVCGAIPMFVIDGFNGFTFSAGNVNDLVDKMIKISNLKEEDLHKMKEHSTILSHRITPQITAASLMSIFK